jgi:hypothetical protein
MSKYDKPRGDTGPTTRTPPPLAEGALVDVLAGLRQAGKSFPPMFPNDRLDAALFWIKHQEPERPADRPEWIWKSNSEAGGSWNTPHVDRVVETLHKFLSLQPAQQYHVIEKIKAGYPYRGDSMEFYLEVIRQSEIRDEYIEKHGLDDNGLLPVEYTGEIMKAAHRLAMQMTGKIPVEA